jgi:hypothetical protein
MSRTRQDLIEWAEAGSIAPENLRRALQLGDLLLTHLRGEKLERLGPP